MPTPHRALLEGCAALWEGLLAAHNRHLSLQVELSDDGAAYRVAS